MISRLHLMVCVCLLAGFVPGAFAQQATSPASRIGGVTLSGRIVDAYPGAQPQPDAVLLMRMDGPPTVPGKFPIRADRTFVVENVVPGEYQLQASRSLTVRRVIVGSSDVSGIDLVVSGQVRLRPDVRMDDGSVVPVGVMYRTQTVSGYGSFGSLGPPPPPAGPGPPGTQTRAIPPLPLTVAPGSRWLFIRPPVGYEVLSASLNGGDVLRAPLETTPADDGRPLVVVLTRTRPENTPTTTVSGTVGDLAGLDVELIDVTEPRRAVAATTITGSDGAFRFAGIRPGLYEVSLPPVDRVVTDVVATVGEVRVDIPVPAGARVVGGLVLVYHTGPRLARPGPITLVAEREGSRIHIPISEQNNFWGALPPGAYRLTVDGLQSGYTVRALTAGSVNLLEQPFVVPGDRPAELLRLELSYVPPN